MKVNTVTFATAILAPQAHALLDGLLGGLLGGGGGGLLGGGGGGGGALGGLNLPLGLDLGLLGNDGRHRPTSPPPEDCIDVIPMDIDRAKHKFSGKCYTCGEPGHRSWQCKKNPQRLDVRELDTDTLVRALEDRKIEDGTSTTLSVSESGGEAPEPDF